MHCPSLHIRAFEIHKEPVLCGMWDLNSPTRDGTCTCCTGSVESKALGHQGSCESVLFLCIYFSSFSYFGAYSVKRKRAYDNNAWLQKAKTSLEESGERKGKNKWVSHHMKREESKGCSVENDPGSRGLLFALILSLFFSMLLWWSSCEKESQIL